MVRRGHLRKKAMPLIMDVNPVFTGFSFPNENARATGLGPSCEHECRLQCEQRAK